MYLSDIQEKHQTKTFKKYFAFFAFSNDQFYEQMNINFKYASLGSGLYAPSVFANKLYKKLEHINKKAIKQHQKLESKKDIIWNAFSNYESQITGDLDDAIQSLENYENITKADIIEEYKNYFQHCIDNDYF